MEHRRVSRRAVVRGAVVVPFAARIRPASAQATGAAFAYPLALPGRAPGDGFVMRHGYATENTWFSPGNLHCGEDWYLIDGDIAGTEVSAIAAGEVVFAGYDYPGLVIVVRHAADLYSMYGHLDYAAAVVPGQAVAGGETLGTVLARSDEFPNHLHFEVRAFLTTPEVNGPAPRYGFACGPGCVPGPGYWPIGAPDHPSDQGWRNPAHVIARRAFAAGVPDGAEVVVAAEPPVAEAPVWSLPEGEAGAREVGALPLQAGARLPLLEVRAGAEATTGTSAEAYAVWYRVRPPDGGSGWVRGVVPSSFDTGADGRPSGVSFVLLPGTNSG